MGPPSHKLPIPFPYFRGFLWEWYGSGMGMGIALLGVPGIFLDTSIIFCANQKKTLAKNHPARWGELRVRVLLEVPWVYFTQINDICEESP